MARNENESNGDQNRSTCAKGKGKGKAKEVDDEPAAVASGSSATQPHHQAEQEQEEEDIKMSGLPSTAIFSPSPPSAQRATATRLSAKAAGKRKASPEPEQPAREASSTSADAIDASRPRKRDREEVASKPPALLASYICPICLSPPTSATTTPCGHLFCGDCLFRALKQQASNRSAQERFMPSMPHHHSRSFFTSTLASSASSSAASGAQGLSPSFRAWWESRRGQSAASSSASSTRQPTAPPPFPFPPVRQARGSTAASSTRAEAALSISAGSARSVTDFHGNVVETAAAAAVTPPPPPLARSSPRQTSTSAVATLPRLAAPLSTEDEREIRNIASLRTELAAAEAAYDHAVRLGVPPPRNAGGPRPPSPPLPPPMPPTDLLPLSREVERLMGEEQVARSNFDAARARLADRRRMAEVYRTVIARHDITIEVIRRLEAAVVARNERRRTLRAEERAALQDQLLHGVVAEASHLGRFASNRSGTSRSQQPVNNSAAATGLGASSSGRLGASSAADALVQEATASADTATAAIDGPTEALMQSLEQAQEDSEAVERVRSRRLRADSHRASLTRDHLFHQEVVQQAQTEFSQAQHRWFDVRESIYRQAEIHALERPSSNRPGSSRMPEAGSTSSNAQEPDIMDIPLLRHSSSASSLRRSGAIRLPMTSSNAGSRRSHSSSQSLAITEMDVTGTAAGTNGPPSPSNSDESWTDSVHSLLAEEAQRSTQEEWWGAVPTSSSDAQEAAESSGTSARSMAEPVEAEAVAEAEASSASGAADTDTAAVEASVSESGAESRADTGTRDLDDSHLRPPWTSSLVSGPLASASATSRERQRDSSSTRDSAATGSLDWGQGSSPRTSTFEPLGWPSSLTGARRSGAAGSSSYVLNLPQIPTASSSAADSRRRYGPDVAASLAAWEAAASDAVHLLRMDLDAAARAAYDGARRAAAQARVLRREEIERERRALRRLQTAIEQEEIVRSHSQRHHQEQQPSSLRAPPQQQNETGTRERSAQAPASSTSFSWRVIQPGSTGGSLVLDSSPSEWSAASNSVSPPGPSLPLPPASRSTAITTPTVTTSSPSTSTANERQASQLPAMPTTTTTSSEQQESQRRVVRSVVRDELRTLMTQHPLPAPLEYVVRQHPLVQRSMGIVNDSAPHPEEVNDAELRSANFGIVVRQMQRLTQLVGEDVRVARVLMEGVDHRSRDVNGDTSPETSIFTAVNALTSSSSSNAVLSSDRGSASASTRTSNPGRSQSRILERIEMLVGQLRAALEEVDVGAIGESSTGAAANPGRVSSVVTHRDAGRVATGITAAIVRNQTASSRDQFVPTRPLPLGRPAGLMGTSRPSTQGQPAAQQAGPRGPPFTQTPHIPHPSVAWDRLGSVHRSDAAVPSTSANDTRLPPIGTFVFGRHQGRGSGERPGTATEASGNNASEPYQFTFRLSPPINLPESRGDNDQLTPAGRWSRIHELADRERDSNVRPGVRTSAPSTGDEAFDEALTSRRLTSLLRSRSRRFGRPHGETNRSDFNFVPTLPSTLPSWEATSGLPMARSEADSTSTPPLLEAERHIAATSAHEEVSPSHGHRGGASAPARGEDVNPTTSHRSLGSASSTATIANVAPSTREGRVPGSGLPHSIERESSTSGHASSTAAMPASDRVTQVWERPQHTRQQVQTTHSRPDQSGESNRPLGSVSTILQWYPTEAARERQRDRQLGSEGLWRLDVDAGTSQGPRGLSSNSTANLGSSNGNNSNATSVASAHRGDAFAPMATADEARDRLLAAMNTVSAPRALRSTGAAPSRSIASVLRQAAHASSESQSIPYDTLSGGTCPLCRTLIGGFNANMEPLPKELSQGASSTTGSTVTGGRSSLASSSRSRLVPPRGVRGLRLTLGVPADQNELYRSGAKPEPLETGPEEPAAKRAKLESGRVDIANEKPDVERKGKGREVQSDQPTRSHEHQSGLQEGVNALNAAQGTISPGSTTIPPSSISSDSNNSLLRFHQATGRYFRMLPRRAFASLRGNQTDNGGGDSVVGAAHVPVGNGGSPTTTPNPRAEAFMSRRHASVEGEREEARVSTIARGTVVIDTSELPLGSPPSETITSSQSSSHHAGADGSSSNAPIVLDDDDDDDDDVVVLPGGTFSQSLNIVAGQDPIGDHIRTPGFAPSGGRLRSPTSAAPPDLTASSSSSSQQRDESASEAEGSAGGPARPLKRRRSPGDDGEEERLVDQAMRFHTFQL